MTSPESQSSGGEGQHLKLPRLAAARLDSLSRRCIHNRGEASGETGEKATRLRACTDHGRSEALMML